MGLLYNNLDIVLEVFFENPSKSFTVREIARITKIPKSTVKNYLDELKKQKLLTGNNEAETTPLFKIIKVNHYVEKIFKAGLVDYLIDKLNPETIILFGGFRKGESDKDSDIDIFVATHEKKDLNLKNFEKKIKHKIDLHFERSINNVQKRLRNNIINGIKLYGSFSIK